ncbi:MAG: hypothetical protein QM811_05755 [Pirellulales bacterium]
MSRIYATLRAILLCGASSLVSVAAQAVELKYQPNAGDLTNYTIDLNVQGQLLIGAGKEAVSMPLQVEANLRYGERRVDDGSLPTETRTLRIYEEAKAVVRVDRESTITKLQDKHTLIRGKVSAGKLRLISAGDPLTARPARPVGCLVRPVDHRQYLADRFGQRTRHVDHSERKISSAAGDRRS